MVNEFGRSPAKSYSDLLGGMRSICFGSVCFGSGPLKFFSRSALFWSIGFGFLKLFAPAAWSTYKGTFDCALLDWERALDRRAGVAPLLPRVDDDCARCLLLVTGLRVGLLPRERERLWEFLSVGPSLEVLALMLSNSDGERGPSSSIRTGLLFGCWVGIWLLRDTSVRCVP